jgi:cyclase
MLKKRLIFTLLYDGSDFVLSRNFRLQKVGDLSWLLKNYQIEQTFQSIDELVVLNVSRSRINLTSFANTLKSLAKGCFAPISAGGGIRCVNDARLLLTSGADKVVVNSLLKLDEPEVYEIADRFGKQCVVASLDLKRSLDGRYAMYVESGSNKLDEKPEQFLNRMTDGPFGELYLTSIDRDGTGHGYDMEMLSTIPANFTKPVILAGGVGNHTHFAVGLQDSRIDGVATAQLQNFIGNGLEFARSKLIEAGFQFPMWKSAQNKY